MDSKRRVRDSRNPRALLYAYKDPVERHCYWFHGVCFAEFCAAVRLRSTLLMLSNGYLEGFDEDAVTRFSYVKPANVAAVARQNIYKACGDFAWVDCRSIGAVQKLSPRDVASLLYVGRFYKVLRSPFKAGLKNRFLYLSHDDGWMLKLYARSAADVERLLEGVAGMKCREFFKVPLKVPGLGRRLVRLCRKGVLMDFRDEAGSEIRVCMPGGMRDMDRLLSRVSGNELKPVARLVCR